MALVLDATLAAAQDAQTRRPLAEVISGLFVPDIPFDGQRLTTETTDEQRPNAITHSSGRLAVAYTFGKQYLKFVYTDTERLEFSFVTIDAGSARVVIEATLCELTDGSIGLVYLESYLGNYQFRTLTLSPTGETISGPTTIQTYPTTDWVNAPFVARLASGTYLLVYAYETGGAYSIQKQTSADFSSWSAASSCAVGGIDSAKRRDNPSLLQISTGDVFLWFDYLDDISGVQERMNVYYAVSTNDGATWGAATVLTAYADFTASGRHPVAVQKSTGQMTVAFHERRGALNMDDTALNWGTGDDSVQLSLDSVNRKLYVVNAWPGGGIKNLQNVVRIDVDTWSCDRTRDFASVPSFLQIFKDNHIALGFTRSDRHLVALGLNHVSNTQYHVALYDGEADTITNFHFVDWLAYGITANVTGLPASGTGSRYMVHIWVDADANRLYITFVTQYPFNRVLQVGYIDLSQPGPSYAFTEIVHEVNQVSEEAILSVQNAITVILPESDLVCVSSHNTVSNWKGFIRLYVLSTGSLYKAYDVDSFPGFHYRGMKNFVYLNNKIYGEFTYESLYGQEDRRGLMEIDLDTDGITYHRPTFVTVDEYYFNKILVTPDGKIAIATADYGVAIYDPSTDTWEQFSNATLPGMTPDGVNRFYSLAYDPINGMFYAGVIHSNLNWTGVIAFSRYGFLRQTQYLEGLYSGGWAFGAFSPLLQGFSDYDASLTLDPDTAAIYAFWTNDRASNLSSKWDKEGAELAVTPYLLANSDLVLRRTIEGTPNKLSFSVSHGHLFDPHNLSSLLSPFLKKFRKLTVRFGETVSGTDYWQEAGTFVVVGNKLSYRRGEYPTLSVEAEDKRVLWEEMDIIATAHYEAFPEDIISNIVQIHAGEDSGGIDLPVFENKYQVWHQWLDTDVKKMIEDICYRFGYFPRITVDDKLSARKIAEDAAVDHLYSNLTSILEFSPDDSFSDFTNRVTVVGETRDFIEVLQQEEPIQALSGTVGWWGHKKTFRIWYSEDHERRCRDPRMEVIASVKNFNFRLGGGAEYISEVDTDEQWVEITVEMPNLVPEVVGLLAGLTALGISCGATMLVPGPCFAALVVLLAALFLIISSIALFQYQVHARTIGHERLGTEGTANDLDFQASLGKIIPKKIEEPLAITATQCLQVANFELMIVRLQRNRVKFTKVAHLQDEEGDTLQVPHPYTGAILTIFVTDLTRKYRKPASAGDDGGFFDEIEGWVAR